VPAVSDGLIMQEARHQERWSGTDFG